MLQTTSYLLMLSALILMFSACMGTESEEEIAPINPSLTAEVIRFDRLIQSLPEDNIVRNYNLSLAEKHPAFSQLYQREIIEARDSITLERELNLIRKDSTYLQLSEEVEDRLGDLVEVIPELSQLFENYLNLFGLSEDQIPSVYAFISGFTYQAFLFDDNGRNGVGLGLDMFLGKEFPYQRIHPSDPSFSQYLARTYTKEHISRKVAEVLVEDKLLPPRKSDFLSLMIWGGKKLYLVDQLLNFVPDTIVTQYTGEQLKWCQNNQSQMWQFFFEEELFYTTDLRKFAKLVGPAPTSPGMPKESPGGTGNYMGWQIVKAFMSRNTDVTIDELIRTEAQAILDRSRYKPPR